MDAPPSFSADADSKGWVKNKALPALKKALPVVCGTFRRCHRSALVHAVILPESAVIGKIAQVSAML